MSRDSAVNVMDARPVTQALDSHRDA